MQNLEENMVEFLCSNIPYKIPWQSYTNVNQKPPFESRFFGNRHLFILCNLMMIEWQFHILNVHTIESFSEGRTAKRNKVLKINSSSGVYNHFFIPLSSSVHFGLMSTALRIIDNLIKYTMASTATSSKCNSMVIEDIVLKLYEISY